MSLVTGQRAALEQQSATMGSRAGAYVLDMLWVSLIPFVVQIGFTVAAGGAIGRGDYSAYSTMISLAVWIPLILRIVLGLFYLGALGSGQTPGMKATKIRLVRLDTMGEPGFWRALGRLIIFSLTFYIIVGPLSPLFDSTGARRGWHDQASGTWMLRDTEGGAVGGVSVAGAGVSDAGMAAVPEVAPVYQVPVVPVAPEVAPVYQVPVAAAAPSAPVYRAAAVAPAPISSVPGSVIPSMIPAGISVGDNFSRDDLDETRAAPPVRSQPRWVFGVDSGEDVVLTGSGLIGRNPQGTGDMTQLVSLLDHTKSMSKTHAAFIIDGDRLGVIDRHSTNGTRVERRGYPEIPVGVDLPVYLSPGDVLLLGDRRVTVSTR
ncbi:RDD family protein [Subtercola sp. PAMC28395]|uniref:RDD family protein n=1 Tax=Subtercola sp. PAMC28395 TaxID=2846775 RepID=UPI001C0D2DB6|nr:RDD family protein [Subtercola sp. PAMC28395]QWT24553.1 RDD family protein [Subtercola sp. PAMC28395]